MSERWAVDELSRLELAGLRRHLEPLQSPQGPVVTVGGRRLVNFSSNDYLGLAADPALSRAAAAAFARWGTGAGASRLVVGDFAPHRALEAELAAWLGTEAAVLFNSGYAANVGTLAALCGPDDVIFSDQLNHASLVDGCRLSRAKVVVYPHRDAQALADLMARHPGRRQLVATDAAFSMDGALAPLRQLHSLCAERGAALLVDEAHATGVLGPTGAGLCEALGLGPDVRMGTLGKALGCFGAYVATSGGVAELLVNRARSLVFSTALPPALCELAREAVRRARADRALQERLQHNIAAFTARLAQRVPGVAGAERPAAGRAAIFAWVLGSPQRALEASVRLRERGLLVKAIRPPTVPPGTSRLRLALSAAHHPEHLELAARELAALA